MNLTKEQWGKILSAVMVFVIAILAVLGYDVAVVQPRRAAEQAALGTAGPRSGPVPAATLALGTTFEAVNVTKNFRSLGAATLAEATIPKLTATTITATTIISQGVGFEASTNGTAGAPVYSFASDTNAGIYRVGADDVGIATNGVLAFDVSATAATSALPLVLPVGSAAAPAATFTGDTNTGVYRVGADDVGISAGGTVRFDVSTTAATSAVPVAHPAGTAGAPSIYITGDTNTGLYQVAADDVGISAGGTLRFDVSATAATAAVPVYLPDGTVTAPAVTFATDTNTGIYALGANDIAFTTNGVLAADISASTVTFALPIVSGADLTFGIGNASAAIAPATQAAATAGNAVTITGGQAGPAATGGAGKNGGAVTITGGLGTDKEGAGTPSGDGGDVVLTGGAKAGATGGNVQGIVRVGAPSVQSTKATNVLAVGGALEVDGAALLDGGLSVTAGTVTGPAEGSVVYNLMVDVIAAEINAGHTVITVPAARAFRLVDATAVAYGATCTTSTSVLLKGGSNTLATYTVANLVRSTILDVTATGVALAADGASFTAQTAGDDVTVISNSADTAGCTGVRFVISYALD